MPSHHINPNLFLNPLFCDEEHHSWDDDEINTNIATHKTPNFNLQLMPGDDDELRVLLQKENEESFVGGSIESRPEAVDWMLKIVGYYSFSAVTAVLAVDYFDRFVGTLLVELDKPWMSQLAAVACLSLAAKVEETRVPLLLDLQVEESEFVFDSKTIQRMELLILSTLNWKMNRFTVLTFLDYIVRKLNLESFYCGEFVRRSHCLLLSLISDCRLMKCLPSALATATMLYVLSTLDPCIGVENQDKLSGILGVDKDKVEECCELIQEVVATTCKKRKLDTMAMRGSPKGTLDVCFSYISENSNDSWTITSTSTNTSVSSSPEPLSKKPKPNDASI